MVSMSAVRADDGRPAVDNWALSQRYAHEGVTVWVPGRGWCRKIGHFYLTGHQPSVTVLHGRSYLKDERNIYRRNVDDFMRNKTTTLKGYDAAQ